MGILSIHIKKRMTGRNRNRKKEADEAMM